MDLALDIIEFNDVSNSWQKIICKIDELVLFEVDNIEERNGSFSVDEFALKIKSVKLSLAIVQLKYKFYGIYQTINLGERFLLNKNTLSEEKLLYEAKAKIFKAVFLSLEKTMNEYKIINTNIMEKIKPYNKNFDIMLECLIKKISNYKTLSNFRDNEKRTLIQRKIAQFDNSLKEQDNLANNPIEIFTLMKKFVQISESYSLLIMAEEIEKACKDDIKNIFSPDCFNLEPFICYFKERILLEHYINLQTTRNLLHLLQNRVSNKIFLVNIKSYFEEFKRIIAMKKVNQLHFFISLLSDESINFESFLLEITEFIESFDEFLRKNDKLSTVSFKQIIFYYLNSNQK